MSSVQYSFFDETEVFDFSQGLNLAIAFSAFDNEIEPILDKSIGEIIFLAYSWGNDESGNYRLN